MTWPDGTDGLVVLADGRRVRATGVRRGRGGVDDPELAVLLLGRDPRETRWPARWVRWRDFGTPHSPADALAVLREAHDRARRERVEIACGSGIGRTGTALGVLAVLSGVEPAAAVAWVRAHHHPRAVETPGQRRWVEAAAPGRGPIGRR